MLLAQSWNLIGGYTGQINLGIAAFFGCSVMVTHFMWVAGIPIIVSIFVGSLSTIILAIIIGIPTLRVKRHVFRSRDLGFSPGTPGNYAEYF